VTSDGRVPRLVFLAIGAILAVMALVYGVTADESAGTTMLVLAACLALMVGVYVGSPPRQHDASASSEHDGDGEHYLPTTSIWPLGIGLAGFFVLNGLLLGTWFLVPGGLLLAGSITGFALQSRRRA
jgi:hypothetical protein